MLEDAKILIGDKEYGLFFGYTCYTQFVTGCVRFKDTYQTESGAITSLGFANLIHAAYLNNCYRRNTEPVLSIDDINEWVDTELLTAEGEARLSELMTVWARSKYIAKLVDEQKKSQPLSENLNLENQQAPSEEMKTPEISTI